MHRVEEVQANDILGMARRPGDRVDWQGRGVGGEDEPLVSHRLHLAQHLVLDGQRLDDRLDDHVASTQARVLEGRLDEGELLLALAPADASFPDLGAIQIVRRAHAARQRAQLDVFQTHRDAAPGEGLGDTASHHPGADHRRRAHLARPHRRVLDAGIAAGLPLHQEDRHQVLAGAARRQRAEKLGLLPQAGLHPVTQPVDHRLEGAVRRRVVRLVDAAAQSAAGDLRRQGDAPQADRVQPGERRFAPARPPGSAPSFRGVDRQPLGRVQEVLGRRDLVHQADLRGAPGVQRPPGQDQIERRGDPDEARQALRPSPSRNDPEAHLGKTDLDARIVGGDAEMAGQDQLGAAAETGAVDGGYHRERQPLDGVEQPVSLARGGLGVLDRAQRADLVDVGAGDERPGLGAHHHERAHVLVVRRLVHQDLQHGHERRRQEVHLIVRPVEDQEGEAVAPGLKHDTGTLHRQRLLPRLDRSRRLPVHSRSLRTTASSARG